MFGESTFSEEWSGLKKGVKKGEKLETTLSAPSCLPGKTW